MGVQFNICVILGGFVRITKTRALSQNVTDAPKGALIQKLKNVKVTVQNK